MTHLRHLKESRCYFMIIRMSKNKLDSHNFMVLLQPQFKS
jgi:hypothetical protein